MNLAILAKQGWRVATGEASLLVKLLKGRYFRRSSFLHAKLGSNPSYRIISSSNVTVWVVLRMVIGWLASCGIYGSSGIEDVDLV
ncbi:hypothetical protein LIER_26068 [Lithospermum erythrorhizon]|uniref:Uncharacterized protein n=1 Tax=Lithospermum erythrorhizon TaxID=34254 RepID=A0AAV3R8M0_LITER